MEALKERIRREGRVLPGNIIKVDGFLDHRVDTAFMEELADEFARYFDVSKITMVLTAEAEDGVDFAQTGGVIRELFKSRIGMTPEVEVVPHGTLARSMKKTKRVIDQRYD